MLLNYYLAERFLSGLSSIACCKQFLYNSQNSLKQTHEKCISWMGWMPSPLCQHFLPLTASSFSYCFQISGISDLALLDFLAPWESTQRHLSSMSSPFCPLSDSSLLPVFFSGRSPWWYGIFFKIRPPSTMITALPVQLWAEWSSCMCS